MNWSSWVLTQGSSCSAVRRLSHEASWLSERALCSEPPSLGEGEGDSAPSRVAREPRKGDINRMKLELRKLRLLLVDCFLLDAIVSLSYH